MAERPKPPPLPLRTPATANRALEEHQRAIAQRQSDHEIKVDSDMRGIATYLRKREDMDRDRDVAAVVLAAELGAAHRMPARLQELARGLPAAQKRTARPLFENAGSAARGASRATFLALAIAALELAKELAPIVRHVIGGH